MHERDYWLTQIGNWKQNPLVDNIHNLRTMCCVPISDTPSSGSCSCLHCDPPPPWSHQHVSLSTTTYHKNNDVTTLVLRANRSSKNMPSSGYLCPIHPLLGQSHRTCNKTSTQTTLTPGGDCPAPETSTDWFHWTINHTTDHLKIQFATFRPSWASSGIQLA